MSYDLLGGYSPPPAAPRLPRALEQLRLPDATTQPGAFRLNPPPAAAARAADLAAVREAVAGRTAAGNAWAHYMDHKGATTMWLGPAKLARQHRGLVKGWAFTALLAASLGAAIVGTHHGQPKLPRQPRPFQMDPALKLLGTRPTTSSYPSGHARQAFTAARLVADFDPSQAAKAYDLAGQVARSRVYAAAHLPSDVVEGARFGTAFAERVIGTLRRLHLHR